MTPVLRANACTFSLKFCCGLIAAFLGTAAFSISAQSKEHPTGTVSFRPASAGRAIPSTPVIIDTDIGDDIDDAYALALAVRSPELRILGITTAFGDTALRAHVAARMLDTLNHPGIPIYVGVNSTRKFENFSQTEYARADTHILVMRDAIDFLLKTALRYPHQVTLIALGPMDNIGAAIDRDPSAFRLLKQVVLMGGSVRTGYGGGPPSAEWNILNNVRAARKLFSSGVPVSMMPLDSTQIRMGAVRDVILNQPDRLSVDLTELTRESNRPDPVLFDPVAVAAVINPKLCPTQPMHLEVDDKGFTLETPGRPNVNVCLTSDREGFLKLLAERLEPRVGASN